MVPTTTKASRLNDRVMNMLEAALEENPEVDLLSVIPPSYKSEISQAEPPRSKIAEVNQWTINSMWKAFRKQPEIDLISSHQGLYRIEYDSLKESLTPSTPEKMTKEATPKVPHKTPDTLERLKDVDTATILSPLSDTVNALLDQNTGSIPPGIEPGQFLARELKQTFRASTKLFENPFGCAVFKCSDEIVAKVVSTGRPDYTEYTALQYLAQHIPEFPAPKPHGLVNLGHYIVMFMSFVPSKTLEEAWPSMTHHQKVSIQRQLDEIFRRLRHLKQPDGLPLGGLGMGGVVDIHRLDHRSDHTITTVAEYENWKFSLSKFAGEQYLKFIRSFLPPPAVESLFTHGDLRPANIMVDLHSSGDWSVTGIIDWGQSGFYPDYHECTNTTNLLQSNEKSDWYHYLPPCIAPRTFPVWWLVDRLWDRNILFGH
jgi:hypothetical protein